MPLKEKKICLHVSIIIPAILQAIPALSGNLWLNTHNKTLIKPCNYSDFFLCCLSPHTENNLILTLAIPHISLFFSNPESCVEIVKSVWYQQTLHQSHPDTGFHHLNKVLISLLSLKVI